MLLLLPVTLFSPSVFNGHRGGVLVAAGCSMPTPREEALLPTKLLETAGGLRGNLGKAGCR